MSRTCAICGFMVMGARTASVLHIYLEGKRTSPLRYVISLTLLYSIIEAVTG